MEGLGQSHFLLSGSRKIVTAQDKIYEDGKTEFRRSGRVIWSVELAMKAPSSLSWLENTRGKYRWAGPALAASCSCVSLLLSHTGIWSPPAPGSEMAPGKQCRHSGPKSRPSHLLAVHQPGHHPHVRGTVVTPISHMGKLRLGREAVNQPGNK